MRRITATILALGLLSVLATAQTPTTADVAGRWKGSIKADLTKLPADQKKNLPQIKKMIEGTKFDLNLMPNGKFEGKVSANGQSGVTKGKWFIRDGWLVTLDEVRAGKPVPKKDQKEDKLKILKYSAKQMSLKLPDQGPITAQLILIR